MKLQLQQLVDSIQTGALQTFANDQNFPISTAFRMKKVWKAALAELDAYNEQRKELGELYGNVDPSTTAIDFMKPSDEKDEEGNPILKHDAKAQAAFEKEMKALGKTDIELPGEPFTMDAFHPRKMDAPALPFSPANLLLLDWLIAEETYPEVLEEKAATA